MKLTTNERGCAVHVTTRVNQGIRIAQGPQTIYFDAHETGNLIAWLDRTCGSSMTPLARAA